jgi:hypothetical protein
MSYSLNKWKVLLASLIGEDVGFLDLDHALMSRELVSTTSGLRQPFHASREGLGRVPVRYNVLPGVDRSAKPCAPVHYGGSPLLLVEVELSQVRGVWGECTFN